MAMQEAKVEYACQNPTTGDLIVVTSNGGYGSFALYVGTDLSGMREIVVTDVNRFRDGGTTNVKTVEGDLHIPSPIRFPDRTRTWKGEPVHVAHNLDPDKLKQLAR